MLDYYYIIYNNMDYIYGVHIYRRLGAKGSYLSLVRVADRIL